MRLQHCVRRFLTGGVLFAGVLCASTASAVTIATEMGVLPQNESLAWASVGDVPLATVGGGVLRINDASASDFLQYSQLLNSQDTTLEGRVKIASSAPDGTGVGAYMALVDAANFGVFLDLQPDKITLVERFVDFDVIGTHAADLTSDFRTLRMTQSDTTTNVFLDGVEIFSYAHLDDFSSHVAFGSLTMGGMSDSFWDYVAYTGDGAFDPAQMDFELDGNDQGGNDGGPDGGEGGASGATSNPEPASAVLLVFGTLLFAARRCRRNK